MLFDGSPSSRGLVSPHMIRAAMHLLARRAHGGMRPHQVGPMFQPHAFGPPPGPHGHLPGPPSTGPIEPASGGGLALGHDGLPVTSMPLAGFIPGSRDGLPIVEPERGYRPAANQSAVARIIAALLS